MPNVLGRLNNVLVTLRLLVQNPALVSWGPYFNPSQNNWSAGVRKMWLVGVLVKFTFFLSVFLLLLICFIYLSFLFLEFNNTEFLSSG
jgi:hypothetical protein